MPSSQRVILDSGMSPIDTAVALYMGYDIPIWMVPDWYGTSKYPWSSFGNNVLGVHKITMW